MTRPRNRRTAFVRRASSTRDSAGSGRPGGAASGQPRASTARAATVRGSHPSAASCSTPSAPICAISARTPSVAVSTVVEPAITESPVTESGGAASISPVSSRCARRVSRRTGLNDSHSDASGEGSRRASPTTPPIDGSRRGCTRPKRCASSNSTCSARNGGRRVCQSPGTRSSSSAGPASTTVTRGSPIRVSNGPVIVTSTDSATPGIDTCCVRHRQGRRSMRGGGSDSSSLSGTSGSRPRLRRYASTTQ